MVCTRKRILIDFINADPSIIHRAIQNHFAGLIVTAKNINDDLKVCVCMPDTGEEFDNLYGKIHSLLHPSDTSYLGRFSVVNFSTRKFP